MPDTKSPQHRYPTELRERAVRMVFETIDQRKERYGVVTRVAHQLGIGTESLRSWVRQAEIDGGQRSGVTTADQRRIAELEREIRELRRANEMAISSGQRNEFCHLLTRGTVPEGLAWPAVEAALDATKLGSVHLG